VDETSQIQALDRTQPLLPMRPGQIERRTHDYVRHGTTSLFAALDAKAGTVIGALHRRHRAIEFRQFLDTVDAAVPATLDIHMILDNASTHKAPLIHRWLARHPRVHLHFTPTGGSWLNMVERWFGLLTEKQIRRGAHRSTLALEAAIRQYIAVSNADPKPFVWTKTADEILASVAGVPPWTMGERSRTESGIISSRIHARVSGWRASQPVPSTPILLVPLDRLASIIAECA